MHKLRALAFAALAAALACAGAAAAGTPLFDVPWVGYDTAVYPEGVGPWASAVADFDGDGFDDLATVSFEGTAHLSILIADGEGGYRPPVTYPLLLESLGVAAGDFDRDGDVDLAVTDTDRRWAGTTISIYSNDGSGAFTRTAVVNSGRNGPSGIVAADINGDGWLDLATAHDGYIECGNTMSYLLNNGAGGFGTPRLLALQSCTRSIAAGDLDGDDDPDVVVGHETNRFTVIRNDDGILSVQSVIQGVPAGPIPELPAVHIADVDRDGDNDVLFTNRDTGGVGTGGVGLHRNNGNATFAPGETLSFGVYSNGGVDVETADVTGDGWPDILAPTEATGNWFLIPGDGAGGFLPARRLRAGDTPQTVEVADLDGDEDLEVIVVATGSQEACVYENPGDGAFVQPDPIDMTSPSISPAFLTNLQAGDIDDDGDLDLVVPYYSDFSLRRGISVRRNNGDGTFAAIEDYTDNRRPAHLRLGDVNGDEHPDLVWIDDSARLKVRLNDGSGAFGPIATKGAVDSRAAFIALHDVDTDGDLDVVYPGFFNVGVRLNDGAANFGPAVVSQMPDIPTTLALGRFDPDGVPDLLTNTGVQGYADISFGEGGGNFGSPFTVPTGRSVAAFAVGDVDADGNLDFGAFYNLDEKGLSIRRGRGDGNFFPAENYHGSRGFNDHTSSLQFADADGDGDLDALTANFSPQDFSVWLNEGDGTYARGLRYGVGETAWDIAFGDFDGDGIGDVAVASQVDHESWWYPGVTIFRGQRTAGLVLTQTALVRGQPATWTVTGAEPGETVRFFFSRTGIGAGPCLPAFGGLCLDLRPPLKSLGSAVADGTGTASVTVTIPQATPVGTTFHAQAVIRRGTGGAESVKSNTSSGVVQ